MGLLGDDKESEKWWNLAVFGFYGTDRELEEAGPGLIIMALVIIVLIFLGIWIFG